MKGILDMIKCVIVRELNSSAHCFHRRYHIRSRRTGPIVVQGPVPVMLCIQVLSSPRNDLHLFCFS